MQREGGPIEEIRAGDGLVSAGRKHWHGAAPTTAITHIAIHEQLDGKVVDWMDKVSNEQYQGSDELGSSRRRWISIRCWPKVGRTDACLIELSCIDAQDARFKANHLSHCRL